MPTCVECGTDTSVVWLTIGGRAYCESDFFPCIGCTENLPEYARSECSHWPLCKACDGAGFCRECLEADYLADAGDRAYSYWKDER